ncbi:MAG: 3TM-type holin [Pseudomonadota bacterium]
MIPAIITALVPALGTLVDRLIPDKAAAERAKADMEAALVKASNEAALAQVEVNKIEAGHSSVFVAGWRPFIGWVCGVALALYYIPMFIIGMALWVWACLEAGSLVPRPELGVAEIIGLVMAMLGLGGLRTFEKLNGVARQ